MKPNLKNGSAILLIALGLVSFTSENASKFSNKGIKRSNLDTTVNPATDFYLFANGGWLKNNPIPETEARWGSFNELQENNNAALRKVLEEAAANTNAVAGSNTKKVGDFYTSGMDSLSIEKAKASSLAPEFAKID